MSVDNSAMMEIYPYGGILAYVKYHFIDGVNKQSVMMADKTRIDYSGSGNDTKKKSKFKQEKLSEKDLSDALSSFGFKNAVSRDRIES